MAGSALVPLQTKKSTMLRALGGRLVTRVKKAHVDPAFAVPKAGDELESEGKLQLTWGNGELNTDTSEDSSQPCSMPGPDSLGPTPSRGVQGRIFA